MKVIYFFSIYKYLFGYKFISFNFKFMIIYNIFNFYK